MTTINPPRALELLSSMYLCKPSREILTAWSSLLEADASSDWQEVKSALLAIDTDSKKVLEDLLWDYTRLFIGPYKLPCPPWESVYRSPARLMLQDAALDVRRIYATFGLSVEETGVMPDHIGAELNFLSLACKDEDGEKFSGSGIGEKFLREHLLNWAPQFAHDMEQAAETVFYRALARRTRHLLEVISG